MLTIHLRTLYSPQEFLRELRTGEIFLVCSLRLWMLSRWRASTDYPDWREGFFRAGISCSAALRFETVCRIVANSSHRKLDIRPLHCAKLGEDEALFLGLLGLLQHDRIVDANTILSSWCPPAAVRLALAPARAFACSLCSRLLSMQSFRGELQGVTLPEPALPAGDSSRLH